MYFSYIYLYIYTYNYNGVLLKRGLCRLRHAIITAWGLYSSADLLSFREDPFDKRRDQV